MFVDLFCFLIDQPYSNLQRCGISHVTFFTLLDGIFCIFFIVCEIDEFQTEIWDSSLYERVFQKEEGVEDTVLNKLEAERLHNAIQQLSEIQRRRLMKYYFEDKNYEQIAQEEGCSFQMVAKSVKAAIRNLKKILR